ncbi:MAG: hypothetical protein LBV67_06040 [Streptococcaceae bacterium]|jgi:hypothetical protein|nr:hypothetical protein [Streptococcaceae bacterium]
MGNKNYLESIDKKEAKEGDLLFLMLGGTNFVFEKQKSPDQWAQIPPYLSTEGNLWRKIEVILDSKKLNSNQLAARLGVKQQIIQNIIANELEVSLDVFK